MVQHLTPKGFRTEGLMWSPEGTPSESAGPARLDREGLCPNRPVCQVMKGAALNDTHFAETVPGSG